MERGWGLDLETYGEARVELVAGDHLRVPIQLALPERPTPVRAAGALTIPAAWERAGLRLVVSGAHGSRVWIREPLALDVASLEPLDAERLAFELELPAIGEYVFEVEPLLARWTVKVGAEGRADLELVVPPPADVQVEVVDAATGEELFPERLNWSAPYLQGATSTASHPAYADPETGRIAFRAPAGEVWLQPDGRALDTAEWNLVFELEPGPNTLTFPVHRNTGVRFTFRDGDAALPWDFTWGVAARQVGGEATHVASSVGVLWFREPGTYELRSRGIPGYESIDGTRFDVQAGREDQEVVVELVPLP